MNKRQRKKQMKKNMEKMSWAVQFAQDFAQKVFGKIKEDPQAMLKLIAKSNVDPGIKQKLMELCMWRMFEQFAIKHKGE